jgi:hypothetical protein
VPPANKRRNLKGIPLPQNNLVPCYYAGSDCSGAPDFEKDRAELRAWRDEGRGFFVCHGRAFQMTRNVAIPERGVSSKAAAVAFSRVQNRLQKPSVVNYPIPAVADHRLRWLYRFMTSSKPQPAEAY